MLEDSLAGHSFCHLRGNIFPDDASILVDYEHRGCGLRNSKTIIDTVIFCNLVVAFCQNRILRIGSLDREGSLFLRLDSQGDNLYSDLLRLCLMPTELVHAVRSTVFQIKTRTTAWWSCSSSSRFANRPPPSGKVNSGARPRHVSRWLLAL